MLKDGVEDLEGTVGNATENLIQGVDEGTDEAAQTVKSLGRRFIKAMGQFKDGFLSSLKENMNILTKTGIKRTLGMTTAYWGADNGLVDSTQAIYASATDQQNVAQDKLKMADWMQILNIVMTVLQAIMEMATVSLGSSSTSDETSVMEQIFRNMRKIRTLTNVAIGTQMLTQVAGAIATTELMINSLFKSELTKQMGQNQSELSYIKATGEQRKMFEQKQIELFASQVEQQIAALYTQVKENGEAEREAAMVLQQSAV